MEGKGVKKVVEAMVLALMLMLLLGAEHSSMAATVDHGNADDDQCIRECLLACPKHENCDLTCPLHCAVQQPTALTNDDSLDAYCMQSCSIAPQCIRFLRDKNRRRMCIAECERTCMANEGRDFY